MDTGKKYKRKAEYIVRQIAGETLLVPIVGQIADLQRVIALNSVGTFIWEELASPRQLAEIGAALAANFAVDLETARRDALDFCVQLEAANLIEPVI